MRKRGKEEESRQGGDELLRREFKEEEARQGLGKMESTRDEAEARRRQSVAEARQGRGEARWRVNRSVIIYLF